MSRRGEVARLRARRARLLALMGLPTVLAMACGGRVGQRQRDERSGDDAGPEASVAPPGATGVPRRSDAAPPPEVDARAPSIAPDTSCTAGPAVSLCPRAFDSQMSSCPDYARYVATRCPAELSRQQCAALVRCVLGSCCAPVAEWNESADSRNGLECFTVSGCTDDTSCFLAIQRHPEACAELVDHLVIDAQRRITGVTGCYRDAAAACLEPARQPDGGATDGAVGDGAGADSAAP